MPARPANAATLRPTRARSRRVSAGEARAQIVAATGRCLRDRRLRELTVEEVMAEAGLARTVFYRHFRSLHDVVLGLLGDLVQRVLADAERGDPRDPAMLARELRMVVDMFAEHGPLLLAFEAAAHVDEDVERAYVQVAEQAAQATASLLERGMALGHTPPLDAPQVARALNSMNVAYLLGLVASGRELDREAAFQTLWTVWSRTTWPEQQTL